MGKRQPFQLMVLGKLDSYMLKKKTKGGAWNYFSMSLLFSDYWKDLNICFHKGHMTLIVWIIGKLVKHFWRYLPV